MLLADSEYRHELETDIEPFKGLLLGLFFITVGAQLDFGLIATEPLMIAGIVVGAMAAKLAVIRLLGKAFGLDRPARWLLAFALAQIGEFAFVLLQSGVGLNVWSVDFAKPLIAAVAISSWNVRVRSPVVRSAGEIVYGQQRRDERPDRRVGTSDRSRRHMEPGMARQSDGGGAR